MTEATFRELLEMAILASEELGGELVDTRSYRETGLLTRNEGLVIRLRDDSEFQIQIVQSA